MGVNLVKRRFKDRDTTRDSFALEKKGVDMGVVGGLLMMGGAAAWFFIGLAGGYIFFYPPVLFVIGIFALLKGLFTGNVAGKRRAPRRRRRTVAAAVDAPDDLPNDTPDADDPRFAGEGGATEQRR